MVYVPKCHFYLISNSRARLNNFSISGEWTFRSSMIFSVTTHALCQLYLLIPSDSSLTVVWCLGVHVDLGFRQPICPGALVRLHRRQFAAGGLCSSGFRLQQTRCRPVEGEIGYPTGWRHIRRRRHKQHQQRYQGRIQRFVKRGRVAIRKIYLTSKTRKNN